jgi:hypothetical protein
VLPFPLLLPLLLPPLLLLLLAHTACSNTDVQRSTASRQLAASSLSDTASARRPALSRVNARPHSGLSAGLPGRCRPAATSTEGMQTTRSHPLLAALTGLNRSPSLWCGSVRSAASAILASCGRVSCRAEHSADRLACSWLLSLSPFPFAEWP